MIDIATALLEAKKQLDKDAGFEAELLLTYILQKDRSYLIAHRDDLLDSSHYSWYQQIIAQRVKGLPIAYITGTREFWSLSLKVNAHTLIPRHETETMIEVALELLGEQKNLHILDLGTGSGAIALALAKERPHWIIDACDISREALDTARDNAKNLGIHTVNFYHSDWFQSLPNCKYHAILSNPPYIAMQDLHLKQGDLRFEPLNALVSSQEGIADLQYIITHSSNYLEPGGLLLLEHGHQQKSAVHAILKEANFTRIGCWQDIGGQDRVSGGQYRFLDSGINEVLIDKPMREPTT